MRNSGFSPWLWVIGLFLTLHGYVGWRLLPALPGVLQGAGYALLVLSVILQPLALMPDRHRLAVHGLQVLGWWLMGLMSFLLVLTALRDLLLGAAFLLHQPVQAWLKPSAHAVLGLAWLATLWGWWQTRGVPPVRHVEIRLPNLPPALDGFTLVQLSDVHVGSTIGRSFLQPVVQRVNGLQPDLIALTGDLVDGSVPHLGGTTGLFADLRARHGVYVVNGNHEYYSGEKSWAQEYQRLGLILLKNQHRVIEHHGARLVVAGVTDYSAAAFDPTEASDPQRALAQAPEGLIRILLAHQPRSAAAAEQAGFDLQLSGHTHGGQYWPWMYAVPLQQPYVAGLHRLGHLQIYVSRGTGYWGPPIRLAAPAEITRIVLRIASE